MRYGKHTSAILLIATFFLFGFGLPKNLEKRVQKEIEKTFEIAEFSWQSVTVSNTLNNQLPAKITADNFYSISNNKELLGYAFVDQAPSKTAKFDYLVVFDTNLIVINSKILIYREEYGGEIGSKRWLKQFLGKTGGDRLDPRTNVDGISGATISVRSMTKAMDNLLQTIEILQKKEILK